MSRTELPEPPDSWPRCEVTSCNKPLTEDEIADGDLVIGDLAPPGIGHHVSVCEECYEKLCDAVAAVFEKG